ncbi:hypothetical protein [Streptomyces sp. NPDC005374]|uniref:hypothetical protein n=1 Tax=Streptomyces sp. NPDC005374 TaxID=3364713 RepID=UPI0036ADE030
MVRALCLTAAGGSGVRARIEDREAAVIGSGDMGPVPQVPKIYVDEFAPLVDRD